MRILAIGDVTSPAGLNYLCKNLNRIRKEKNIDFCIVNGENASFISGINGEGADRLLVSGADVITGGNHTLQAGGIGEYLDSRSDVLRPVNYGGYAAGRGYSVIDIGRARVLVVNAMGNSYIEPVLDNPYNYIDKALRECRGEYDIAVMDIHAESTGEKLALAFNYDGVFSVIFGTHTHVPTADGRILPAGTGYISDLGMCGESGGIMGMDPATVLVKMKARLPGRFKAASGPVEADGVIFTVDDATKKTVDIERIRF